MFKLLILSFLFSNILTAQEILEYKPMTWDRLKEFQKGSLLPIKTFRLSKSCPDTLTGLKNSYSAYPTSVNRILGSYFIWTEFYNNNDDICVVKHLKPDSLNSKPLIPSNYSILNILEARTLLSAAASFGFKEKNVSNELFEEELVKRTKKDNLTSKRQLRVYGGDTAVYKFMNTHNPFTNNSYFKTKKFKINRGLIEGPIYLPDYSTQLLNYFERNYSKKQRQVLINRIKNRAYSKSDLVLLENYWSLISIKDINSSRKDLLENSVYKIHFDKDVLKFLGNIECNKFSGQFSLEKDKLNLNIGMMTDAGCLHFPVINKTF
jgi:hypothetical protein